MVDPVRELLGDRAVDIVVDPVGGDRMTDSLRSLAPEGRLLVIGFAAGEIPTVKVNRVLLGNTAVLGVASRCSAGAFGTFHTRHWSGAYVMCRAGRSTEAG